MARAVEQLVLLAMALTLNFFKEILSLFFLVCVDDDGARLRWV